MNTFEPHPSGHAADAFGARVAARLDAGAGQLPHDISERLRVARLQAVSRRKTGELRARRAKAPVRGLPGLAPGSRGLALLGRLAALVPAVLLAAGLFAIQALHNERRAQQIAEVDAALLTDELPPSAYTDPGFLAFVREAR